MIAVLLGAHVAGIILAALAGRRSMAAGLFAASVAPALATVWAIIALINDRAPAESELVWVADLDLVFRFRVDNLALMMVTLVSGIGAIVFVYASGYFSADALGGTRFPATLLAFSTAMLGLVLADSVWTLFVFWELTSVTSFLLVGHKHADSSVRTAARQALLITGIGGLLLLTGLLYLSAAAGTTILSDLPPASGATASAAGILIMIAAATKSAQFPFHVWLPGAMAAPTPVSAYLHSATMVKAGVLLVAVIGPAMTNVAAWKIAGMSFGIVSMLWGAVGALRHRDAKLILAWGTISQLGLLITLLAVGSAKAVFAGIAVLFAHALFKAALFLVVGEVDIRTGTRDIAELGGLARKMPIAFGVAATAGASMIGAPPLLGFMAKEAAIEAVLGLSGLERAIALPAIVGGSVLTVAYTTRFLWAVFGPGPDIDVRPRRLAMTIPAVLLALISVAGYVFVDIANAVVRPAVIELAPKADVYFLVAWPGLKAAFVVSVVIVLVGLSLGLLLARRVQGLPPQPVGARAVDSLIDGVLNSAPRVIARVQHGSLPVYLATMAAAVSLAAIPFVSEVSLDHLIWWDHPIQAALAVSIVASGLAGAFVGSRLGAALTLGAVGIGVSGLFIVHGAPDLVLTQLLVETIIVVGFVIGLGHLARRFPAVSDSWKSIRIGVAVAGGLAVMVALAAASGSPTGRAPIAELAEAAVGDGGGNNIVNVVLTDIRALDTLGEVVVLATVAVGILALSRARKPEVTP